MKARHAANLALSVCTALVLIAVLCSAAPAATVAEVTRALSCPCGCGMLVSACEGSMQCTAATGITAEVSRMVQDGWSKEKILADLVSTHGERILAAPTKEGFNLTAWILPFAVILIAGALVYLFLSRCLTARRRASESRTAPQSELDSEYWVRMEKELQQREL